MTQTEPNDPGVFQALRTRSSDGRVESRVESMTVADLSAGDVLIRTRYAGVNYKDCLACTGGARIITDFPRVAGIELAGHVVRARGDAFHAGQAVLVHGFGTGISLDGGFAAYARVPAGHVMALPQGLDILEAATLGVPGFTVGLALEQFEALGLTPAAGMVAVSGASGAVGTLAINILARAGYRVAAITRRAERTRALLDLGAAEVIHADILEQPARALEKPRFAAAIDNVGGATLSWLLRSMADRGLVASVGNAGGNSFEGSVLPFFVRRVHIFGVLSNAEWPARHRIWARLAAPWKPDFRALQPHVRTLDLDGLLPHVAAQLRGATAGRALVDFGEV